MSSTCTAIQCGCRKIPLCGAVYRPVSPAGGRAYRTVQHRRGRDPKPGSQLGTAERGSLQIRSGPGKKLLLANTFAVVADNIYSLTEAGHQLVKIPVTLAWLGSFAYTLQIF